ncbi:vacuolar sorting protein Vps24 [Schizosaccharomyces cryophilus OY26]|uniref:Vacuolar sorting protein Vps24 n=1 Tax=Schizosaccharomyces cryophilus (strain OY26 / ATCC MYA-4695 / CBS 11777 / NBRC 106824 / NRRL Y48691) TaxID=653667 RepID=S9XDR6_SCHCR|nr:vacuolar sorting protein Vps24 [Schizosaccharomyces cryophilus OY26]EPY51911.1 vacuolar sorting protein Vps24 [Schizosaccharomyces cryophilus OY26]
MQTVRSYLFGPTPQEQNRKWQSTLRKEQRNIDRQVLYLQNGKKKAEAQMKALAKQQDVSNMRVLAKELARANRHRKKLAESKAMLGSLSMQLNDQIAMYKVEKAMQSSTSIMQSVSSLVRLPQLSQTMRNLSMELTRAGILEEMRDEMIFPVEEEGLEELDDEDEEIKEILSQFQPSSVKPSVPVPNQTLKPEPEPVRPLEQTLPSVSGGNGTQEYQEIDNEQLLDIRGKLDALKS